ADRLEQHGITGHSVPRGPSEPSLSELAMETHKYRALGQKRMSDDLAWSYQIRFAIPVAALVLSLVAFGVSRTMQSRARRLAAVVPLIALYWAALVMTKSTSVMPPA